MIRRDGDRLLLSGPATLQNAGAILQDVLSQLREGVRVIDLGGVTEIDSSLLAMLLAWMREARLQGSTLAFEKLPQGIATIAGLYGVDGLLPAAHASQHSH